ncbi:MAG: AraC family transcriptional regulator [Atopobiaceae bacterium]|nr:AraC family transcriptional regulator [Atopobiaceae bacterium]
MKETVHEAVVPTERQQVHLVFHDSMTPESFSPHWHRAIEVDCMLRWAPTDIFVDGKTYRMETGRIWCANSEAPHTIHTLSTEPRRRAVSIMYPLHYVRGLFPDIDEGRIEMNDLDALTQAQRDAIANDLFPRFERAGTLMEQGSDPLRFIELGSIQLEVLHTLLESFFVKSDAGRLDSDVERIERVHAIVDYVEQHYAEDVRLEDLCEVCHLSRGYMARFVKAHLGRTAGDYVGLVRAEHARADLVSGRGNQSEVAALNGYSGLRTMNRQLKEYFGKSARELVAERGEGGGTRPRRG